MKQTTAKVLADSINPWGKRITTFELEYPRLVHSEFMTHRQFSRNAASSRAIPIESVIAQVKNNPAFPSKWGKNKKGMQADEELSEYKQQQAKELWLASRDIAVAFATSMNDLRLHKQVVNRILEPYQFIKVVMTTTEYDNWKWLRLHKDADPTIYDLAESIEEARNSSIPLYLEEGMWHIPYVNSQINVDGFQVFYEEDSLGNENLLDVENAIKIGCSSCAQVSYRKLDKSKEKAEDLYQRLVDSEPVHASAFEHVAKVCEGFNDSGITGYKIEGKQMQPVSGNFTGGWIQYRQLIPNNAKQ